MAYSIFAHQTDSGPRTVPLTGLQELSPERGEIALDILQTSELLGGLSVNRLESINVPLSVAGSTNITGNLTVSGYKNFRIDDPLDPANKYLVHAAIESPEVLNVYSGNVTTDDTAQAVVALPNYFEAINRDFRYQLTVVGQFAQAIVASEIKGNSFTIATDKPNVKVSWQVTGVRNDPYTIANPMQAEQDKPADKIGTYVYPEGYNQPPTTSEFNVVVTNKDTPEAQQQRRQRTQELLQYGADVQKQASEQPLP